MKKTRNRIIHQKKTDYIPILLSALMAVALTLQLSAQTYPKLTGRVVDAAQMISPAAERRISERLESLERSDSTQIVVATVGSLEGYSIEQYSLDLAEQWQTGQKETGNGALLLVSRADKKIRIEAGYGLEGSLTDLVSGRIIRNIMFPAFQQGDFDSGFESAVETMTVIVSGEYAGTGSLPGERQASAGGQSSIYFFYPLLIFLVLNIFMRPGTHRGRRGGGSTLLLWALLGMGAGSRYRGTYGGHSSFGGGGGFGGGGASGGW